MQTLDEIMVPVPLMRAKGRSDSVESAKAFCRGTFGQDPDRYEWTRVESPDYAGKPAPPEYGHPTVRAKDAATWVGRPKIRPA